MWDGGYRCGKADAQYEKSPWLPPSVCPHTQPRDASILLLSSQGIGLGTQSLGHPSSKQVQPPITGQLCPPPLPTQVSLYRSPLTPGQAQHPVSSVLFTQLGDVVAAVYKGLSATLALGDEACPALATEFHRDIAHAILTTLPKTLVGVLTSCGKPRPGVSLSHQESIRPDFR